MKLTRKVVEQVEARWIRIDAPVKYDEEDMPNDFPGRCGDLWRAMLNIDTHELFIDGFPIHLEKPFTLHMKVTDAGSYWLLSDTMEMLAARVVDYVPHCFPGTHYGDYIQFEIVGSRVTNWYASPAQIAESFFGK